MQPQSSLVPIFTFQVHMLALVLALFCCLLHSTHSCDPRDRASLLDIHDSLSASAPLDWTKSVDCCQWEGISCDQNDRVSILELPEIGLNGSISPSICNLTALTILDMSENYLEGSIPQDIGNLAHLKRLDLFDNHLDGVLPSSLMNCTRVVDLILSSNNLSGDLSSWSFSSLTSIEYLDLRYNKFSGSLHLRMFSGLVNLSYLDLSHNQIWGALSSRTYSYLARLRSLDLSHNKITGPIPRQIVSLYFLETLDLSYNELSGRIPDALNKFQYLSKFDISYNHLEGPIPSGGQLDTFPSSSYQGNSKLCGYPLSTLCSPVHLHEEETKAVVEEDHTGTEKLWFGIDVAFGFLTGFLGVCYSFLFSATWRNAYFNFLIHLKDQVYVFIAIRVNRYRWS